MKELVPAIGGVLRSGVGLNTRAGAARFISRLCLRRGSLVRPHAGKLFKSLLSAAESDRSASVFAAMIAAVASVARHATEARVNQLVEDAAVSYEAVDDDNHERRATLATALCLELSRNASDALRDHATKILPLAFVGRFDEDEKRRRRWEDRCRPVCVPSRRRSPRAASRTRRARPRTRLRRARNPRRTPRNRPPWTRPRPIGRPRRAPPAARARRRPPATARRLRASTTRRARTSRRARARFASRRRAERCRRRW